MRLLFYHYPRLLVLTILLIMASGLTAYHLLPRKEDPSLISRFALIHTRFPGASAERVEALITKKIEDALGEIEDIAATTSTSRTGVSMISVELHETIVNTSEVWSRVRDRLDNLASTWPSGAHAPVFNDTDTAVDAYTVIVALTWEGEGATPFAILRRHAEELEDLLQALPGTKHTQLFGDPQEEIRIAVDHAQLVSLGLTSADISQAMRRTDAKVAAGQLRHEANDLLIEVEGKFDALQRVRRTPIRTGATGQMVYVGDIADVRKTIAEPPADLALIHGKPGIVLAVRMDPDRRVDRWVAQVRDKLEMMRQQLPRGIALEVIFDQSQYVAQRLSSLQKNLFYSAILVLMVSVLMMGWKAALLVTTALPLSSLMVLTGMRQLDVPLHQMSVTGLIVALGLLLDNAIIIVDEIRDRLRRGLSPAQAVRESVGHLAIPLLCSTLTTVFAFMPLVLMPGGAGEFIGPIGISVILALGSSYIIALTITAALTGLTHHGHDPVPVSKRGMNWWHAGVSYAGMTRVYRATLAYLFARPVYGILVALLLPIIGFVTSLQLEEQFFPPSDRDQLQLQLNLQTHTSLQRTQAMVREISTVLRDWPEVTDIHWFIGGDAPKFYYNMLGGQQSQASYFAQALVQLHNSQDIVRLVRSLQTELDVRFPSAQTIVKQLEQGPLFDAPIEIHLYGADLQGLQQIGERLRQILSQIPDVIHTQATLHGGQPKLWFQFDMEEMHLAGLDNVGIANQLQLLLEGAVGGSLLEGTERLPIRVRLQRADRENLAAITSLDFMPQMQADRARLDGRGIPAQSIGHLQLVPEWAIMPHRDGERSNTVQGFITAGVLPGTVLARLKAQLQAHNFTLPPGYRYEFGGEASERNEAVNNLMASVGVLLILMMGTLVLSFNSFRMAAIIASVAGLSAGLSLLSLWLFNYPFGFMSIIGTMGLVGIAVNDAIVVLAAIREHPDARLGEREAIQEVVLHSTRHIITTSLTTIAGFIPLLIDGGEFWPPLAITIAGGVAGATLLALYFVPSAYLVLVWPHASVSLQHTSTAEIDQQALVSK